MSHIFISYARKDINYVRTIVTALEVLEFDVWIDLDDLPKGEDWEQEIYRKIEEADAFLFLISPNSVKSPICNKEISHAVANGKRILPIVIRDTEHQTIPPEASKRNWVFCREGQDDFNTAMEETQTAVRTDYEWLKFHTELQIKALAWEEKKDTSRLLRGTELREAEQKLVDAGSQKDPQPTTLHRQYLLASQRNEIRVRRQVTFGLVTGLAIMLLLSLIALEQRNEAFLQRAAARANEAEARRQAKIARSGELSAQAESAAENYPQRALLLAVEALHILPEDASKDTSARQVLYDRVANMGGMPLGQNIVDASFSEDERWLILWSSEGTVRILDLSAPYPSGTSKVLGGNGFVAESVRFDPTGRWLITESETISYLWDLSLDDPFGVPMELKAKNFKFSPDGKWLAGMVSGNESRLWDLSEIKSTPATSDIEGSDLEFTSNGHWLISRGDHIYLYDLTLTGPTSRLLDLGVGNDIVQKIAVSSDGHWLAVGRTHNNILLYDLSEPDPQGLPLSGPGDEMIGLLFSPDGRWLAMSTNGGTEYIGDELTRLWDLSEHGTAIPFIELAGAFNTFSPDSQYLATDCLTAAVSSVWELSSQTSIAGAFWCRWLSFSTDAQWVAIVDGRREASLYLTSLADAGEDRKKVSVPSTGFNNALWKISPDGNFLALANGNAVKLVRLYSDVPLADTLVLQGHQGNIEILSFSPDGHWLMAGGEGNSISLWDISEIFFGAKLITLGGYESAVSSLVSSPAGRWLVAMDRDNRARLYDLLEMPTTAGAVGIPVSNRENTDAYFGRDRFIALSPDNHWLAMGGFANTIQLLDLSAPDPWKDVRVLQRQADQVTALSFSHSGHWLASGGLNQQITVWDLTSLDFPAQNIPLTVESGAVQFLAFSPDDRWLAASSVDEKWELWSLSDLEKPASRRTGRGMALFFSPDSQWFATTKKLGGETSLWNLTSASLAPIDFKSTELAPEIIFSPDSRWILVDEYAAHTTRLLDFALPDPLKKGLLLPGNFYWGCIFSSDGRWLAAGTYDGNLFVMDLTSDQALESSVNLPAYDSFVSYGLPVIFSGNGNWLATSTDDDVTRVWKLSPSLSEREARDLQGVLGSFSPDGDRLVTRSVDNIVRLWDLDEPDQSASPVVLGVLNGAASSLLWSSHGKWLAGLESQTAIKLWKMDEKSTSPSFTFNIASGDSLASEIFISQDENWLVYDDDYYPRLWPLDSRNLITLSCRAVGRNFTPSEWTQYFPGEEYRLTCPQWPAGQ